MDPMIIILIFLAVVFLGGFVGERPFYGAGYRFGGGGIGLLLLILLILLLLGKI